MTDAAVVNLDQVADELSAEAADSSARRAARTVHAGTGQRQTLLALAADAELAEHENPGDATLLVLRGRVRLRWAGAAADAGAGQLITIPDTRHSLAALEPSVALLTVPREPTP